MTKAKPKLKGMNIDFGGIWHVQLTEPNEERELPVHGRSCSGLLDRLQGQREGRAVLRTRTAAGDTLDRKV